MKLIKNWRKILRHAWSVRLIVVALVLTVLEVALPWMGGVLPPGLLGILAGLASAGAFIARLLVQKELSDEDAV